MTVTRRKQIHASNNSDDPRKNICGLRVATALGVERRVRYLHTMSDLVRAARAGGFLVRSRRSRLPRAATVGTARAKCEAIGAKYYLARVEYGGKGHVILLGRDGRTLIDSDPRERDRRRVTHFYGVWRKAVN